MRSEMSVNRRSFMKTAAAFGSYLILLSLGGRAQAAAPEPQSRPIGSGLRYRLTEHVRRYYETARM